MVCMVEVDLGIYASLAGSLRRSKIRGERISIFFHNVVVSVEVHTEVKQAVLFLDEKNRCTMWRGGGPNEAKSKMFIQEVSESFQF